MRSYKLIAVVICACAVTSCLAEEAPSLGTPKEVVARFSKMEAQGGRLSPEGWSQGAVFFVKPASFQKRTTMLIIDDVILGQTKINGGQAEVWAEYLAFGKLDWVGRFNSTVGFAGGSSQYPVKGPTKFREPYKLKLSSEHWDLANDGTLKAANGPAEWRIDPFQPEPRISIETAIRYLITLRDKTTDAVIKKNAQRSIAALQRLKTEKN